MVVFPAIDMLGGRVVRLFQGDYAQSEVYGDDPARYAAGFEQAGASHLHLVDLDGARAGKPANFALVRNIAQKTGLFIELGGGIRDEATVEQCFEAGVGRVILGTAALKDPDFTRRMVQKHGGKIAVGVDARDGRVAVEGWLETSDTGSYVFCARMAEIGVEYIIYTDISRDGAQRGANLDAYRRLAQIQGLNITASGGVSSLEDVRVLREIGCYAVILGKALYTGAVSLEEVLRAAEQ
uniref:1-(5-phosphoribosyl)-5-[(5-phosphoribosylamino)methylideneamino]imidazole-4-carboxamideisomerase n=1 Tax=termite gut metagenome TaxID=433724 RepID=S0DDE7_9ZZZZ